MIAQLLAAATLVLASSAFTDGGRLPQSAAYNMSGCGGQNIAPALHWTGAPAETKSFALTMHDPDAHAPGGWWHWIVFNIPASRSDLNLNAQSAVQPWINGTTSFKSQGYGGPCPPPGPAHHYNFTIYALDIATVPGATGDMTGPQLVAAIEGHVLAKATLTGMYSR
ncbi:MAG: YbhB/YbcL family Raf kinase inhibitor-like protein [Candidatus Eremiobacteraeota bacterium]|nr:YbhB/YbcL family Raf kinase inhibitor-like protein [Candidatus Eremiobacteraeota bacterium]